MEKTRLEAFSDGVIAVIITIMVLEMKIPHGAALSDLHDLIPVFMSYVLSYIYIGIYWNNHHHMFHAVRRVDGPSLWANLHLLFWLSLLPFTTGWVAENHFALYPVVLYGFILMMAAVAYYILARVLTRCPEQNPNLVQAIGSDFKGRLSIGMYLLGMGLAFLHPWAGFGLYICVAAMWLVPDRRIEKNLHI